MFRLEDWFNVVEILKYFCYLYPLSSVSKTHENSLTLFMEIVKCYFKLPKTLFIVDAKKTLTFTVGS